VTTVQMSAANRDEMNAVNLADEHAEEATSALMGKDITHEAAALVHALLALGARIDALRETLNRELPDIGAAMLEAVHEMPDGD
jgi:hypothetical protein